MTPIAAGWKQENRRKLMDRFELFAYNAFTNLFGQTPAQGAQPLVYAACEPDVENARLWEKSERLTGVRYDIERAHHSCSSLTD